MDNLNKDVNNSGNSQGFNIKNSPTKKVGEMEQGRHRIELGPKDKLPSVNPQKITATERLQSHDIQKIKPASKILPLSQGEITGLKKYGIELLGRLEQFPSLNYESQKEIINFINQPNVKELLEYKEGEGLLDTIKKISTKLQTFSSQIEKNFDAHLEQIGRGMPIKTKEKLEEYKKFENQLNLMRGFIPKAAQRLKLKLGCAVVETILNHLNAGGLSPKTLQLAKKTIGSFQELLTTSTLKEEYSPNLNRWKSNVERLQVKLEGNTPKNNSVENKPSPQKLEEERLPNKIDKEVKPSTVAQNYEIPKKEASKDSLYYIAKISKRTFEPMEKEDFAKSKKFNDFSRLNSPILSDQELQSILNSLPKLETLPQVHDVKKEQIEKQQIEQPRTPETAIEVKKPNEKFDEIKSLIESDTKKTKLVFDKGEIKTKNRSFLSRFIFRNKRIGSNVESHATVTNLLSQLINAAKEDANPLNKLQEAKELLESLGEGGKGNFWIKEVINKVPGILKNSLVDVKKAINAELKKLDFESAIAQVSSPKYDSEEKQILYDVMLNNIKESVSALSVSSPLDPLTAKIEQVQDKLVESIKTEDHTVYVDTAEKFRQLNTNLSEVKNKLTEKTDLEKEEAKVKDNLIKLAQSFENEDYPINHDTMEKLKQLNEELSDDQNKLKEKANLEKEEDPEEIERLNKLIDEEIEKMKGL